MYCKISINKHIIEVTEYDRLNTNAQKPDIVAEYGQSTNYLDNYAKTVQNRRKTVFDLAIANFDNLSKFLTLTFAENMQDLKVANYELKKFIQRLSYHLEMPIEYLAPIEFQDRGAIHYHILLNIPYVPKSVLTKLWGHGHVKINRITHVDNLGAYVTKYMTKSNADPRLQTTKGYLCSKGLDRPRVLKSWNGKGNDMIIKALIDNYGLTKENAVYHQVKDTGDNGKIHYLQYNLKRKPTKKQ